MNNFGRPPFNRDTFGIMKPPIETIRVSQRGREILIKLKRRTGIEQWNIICRWALLNSLANTSRPPQLAAGQDSNIEIKWQTFAGSYADLYVLLVQRRAIKDFGSLLNVDLGDYFRAHLERGLSVMQNRRDLEHFMSVSGTTAVKSLSSDPEQ